MTRSGLATDISPPRPATHRWCHDRIDSPRCAHAGGVLRSGRLSYRPGVDIPNWIQLTVSGLAATLALAGCAGSAPFPAPPSAPTTSTPTQTVVVPPDQRLALAAVLTTTDVAAEFDGSGGQPRIVSP